MQRLEAAVAEAVGVGVVCCPAGLTMASEYRSVGSVGLIRLGWVVSVGCKQQRCVQATPHAGC